MKGRKPKSVAAQIAEGDPSKRGVNKLQARAGAEPKATRGLPACPKHLKGIARKAWNFWREELGSMQLDARPDAMMLEGCCVSYAPFVELHELIETQGKLVAQKERNPQTGQMEIVDVRPHPGLHIRDRALMQMRAFCSEFGLSPVSRTWLTIDKGDKLPDLADILNKPRVPRVEPVH